MTTNNKQNEESKQGATIAIDMSHEGELNLPLSSESVKADQHETIKDIADSFSVYAHRIPVLRASDAVAGNARQGEPLQFHTVSLVQFGGSSKSTVFGTKEPDMKFLAESIVKSGDCDVFGRLLMNNEFVRELTRRTFPNYNRPTRTETWMVPYVIAYETVAGLVSKYEPGANPSDITSAILDLLMYILPGNLIEPTRGVVDVERKPQIFANVTDLYRAAVAEVVQRKLTAADFKIKHITSKDYVTRDVIETDLIHRLGVLGAAMLRSSDVINKVRVSMAVVAWYVTRHSVVGFPDDMVENEHLQDLIRNATFVRLSLQIGATSIATRTDMWRDALSFVASLLKEPRYFNTMPLSSFIDYCGHEHIMGRKERVISTIAYMNMPGSTGPNVGLEVPLTKNSAIVDLMKYEVYNDSLEECLRPIIGKTSKDFAEKLIQFADYIFGGPFLTETGRETGAHKIPAPELFCYMMDHSALWHYAVCLADTIIPIVRENVVVMAFVVPATEVNIAMEKDVSALRGTMITINPADVVALKKGRSATKTLELKEDGIPSIDNDKFVTGRTIEDFALRKFDDADINWKVDLHGGIYNLQFGKLHDLFCLPKRGGTIALRMPRTMLMLNTFISIVNDMNRAAWSTSEPASQWIMAKTIYNLISEVGSTDIGRRVISSVQLKIVTSKTTDAHRLNLETAVRASTFAAQMRDWFSRTVLVASGVLTHDHSRYLDDLFKDAKVYDLVALSDR